MEIIKVDNVSNFKIISNRIKSGEVGVILSDTIYGISCLATNLSAVDRIYQIKNRPKDKPFVFLISDFKMLKKYFLISLQQEKILKNIWLDDNFYPTTFILTPKKSVEKKLGLDSNNGLAVRLPKNDFLIKMIKSLEAPLISTSCNLSGEKEVNNLREIISLFKFKKEKPDFFVSNGKVKPRKKPSKIVDIRQADDIKIIRF